MILYDGRKGVDKVELDISNMVSGKNFVYNHVVKAHPKGMHFAPHTHDNYELLMVMRGRITYSVEGRFYRLKRGDIIWVEFGINVGTELSDHQTKGHYAIVWAVDLGNVIVIPLSSRPAPGSCLTYDVGVIDGLVEEGVNYRSYLKLDAIRSISKRRIGRMPGKCGGKVTIDNKLLTTIQEIIKKNLVD